MPRLTDGGLVLPDDIDLKIRKREDGKFVLTYTEFLQASDAMKAILTQTIETMKLGVDLLHARGMDFEIIFHPVVEAEGQLQASITMIGSRAFVGRAVLGEFQPWIGDETALQFALGVIEDKMGAEPQPIMLAPEEFVRKD